MSTIPIAAPSNVLDAGRYPAAKNAAEIFTPSRTHGEEKWIATAVVYCEANFGAIDGKTANGLVRHWETYNILSVIDSKQAGLDAGEVLGEKPNAIPICRDLADALTQAEVLPDYFIYGMALKYQQPSKVGGNVSAR